LEILFSTKTSVKQNGCFSFFGIPKHPGSRSHNFLMTKSDPIRDGDFAIVINGRNKGQAVIVQEVLNSMAHVYFPLRDTQKTLRLTSLHNRHHTIEGHPAFKDRTKPLVNVSVDNDTTVPPSPPVSILPPSVDAAIVALCEALDSTHMDPDQLFLQHVEARLQSTRRRS
jgi:hypothetical protein